MISTVCEIYVLAIIIVDWFYKTAINNARKRSCLVNTGWKKICTVFSFHWKLPNRTSTVGKNNIFLAIHQTGIWEKKNCCRCSPRAQNDLSTFQHRNRAWSVCKNKTRELWTEYIRSFQYNMLYYYISKISHLHR